MVLNSNGGEIKDPDTGEVIGIIDVPKVLVKVIRVAPKISVASTFRKYTLGGGAFASPLGGLFAPPVTRFETLRTDEQTFKEELTEEDSYVRLGDIVRQYNEEDFAGWGSAE